LSVPFRVVESIFLSEIEMEFDQTREAEIRRGERERTERLELEKRFRPGKRFRVTEGPFASFTATVEGLTDRDEVRVLVDIFKRMTPVTLDPSALAA
jgi:transcription antitermination factor NusG